MDLGEGGGIAPETIVAAAVGAHFHVVENIGIKSWKRVGIFGDIDGIGLVAVKAELPGCGTAVLRPTHRGRTPVEIRDCQIVGNRTSTAGAVYHIGDRN